MRKRNFVQIVAHAIDAIVVNDGKIEFLTAFAVWLEMWCQSRSDFCL